MNESIPVAGELDPGARFALMQLCSTAYLSAGTLDDRACVGLGAVNLASQDPDGFWSATEEGKKLFAIFQEKKTRDRQADASGGQAR